MKFFALFIFFILLLFVHATILTIPIFISVLLMVYIFKKESWAFPLAFFSGIILDTLTVRDLGISSLFMILFLLLVVLYENKFEIKTIPFVLLASFIGSFFYLLIFNYDFALIQGIVNACVAGIIFLLFEKNPKEKIAYR